MAALKYVLLIGCTPSKNTQTGPAHRWYPVWMGYKRAVLAQVVPREQVCTKASDCHASSQLQACVRWATWSSVLLQDQTQQEAAIQDAAADTLTLFMLTPQPSAIPRVSPRCPSCCTSLAAGAGYKHSVSSRKAHAVKGCCVLVVSFLASHCARSLLAQVGSSCSAAFPRFCPLFFTIKQAGAE